MNGATNSNGIRKLSLLTLDYGISYVYVSLLFYQIHVIDHLYMGFKKKEQGLQLMNPNRNRLKDLVLPVTIFCRQFDSSYLSQVTALGDTQYADNFLHKVS